MPLRTLQHAMRGTRPATTAERANLRAVAIEPEGVAQLGWIGTVVRCDQESGDGVGDDQVTPGVDGIQLKKLAIATPTARRTARRRRHRLRGTLARGDRSFALNGVWRATASRSAASLCPRTGSDGRLGFACIVNLGIGGRLRSARQSPTFSRGQHRRRIAHRRRGAPRAETATKARFRPMARNRLARPGGRARAAAVQLGPGGRARLRARAPRWPRARSPSTLRAAHRPIFHLHGEERAVEDGEAAHATVRICCAYLSSGRRTRTRMEIKFRAPHVRSCVCAIDSTPRRDIAPVATPAWRGG